MLFRHTIDSGSPQLETTTKYTGAFNKKAILTFPASTYLYQSVASSQFRSLKAVREKSELNLITTFIRKQTDDGRHDSNVDGCFFFVLIPESLHITIQVRRQVRQIFLYMEEETGEGSGWGRT